MILVAIKGLLGRKLRAILTGLAIILGVAMVSGTFVLTDTIEKAFNRIFSSSYENTSVVISGKELVKGASSGKPTVPSSLLARVRALPDVQKASGAIIDFSGTTDIVKLISKNGKTISGGGAPNFGFGIAPGDTDFNPMKLVQGRWASGPDQVVVDNATAKKHHFAVGDRIGASGEGPIRKFTITGTAKLGGVDSIGGATIAVFDLPTAQELLRKQGQYDVIAVAAKSGTSNAHLLDEIRPILPPSAQVSTGDQKASTDSKNTTSGIGSFRIFLLAFAGIALFVGAFVIFNTISITVAQRTREFATLRTLGASRPQVLRSVVIEAFVIGLVSSVIGLLLGIGLAKGLNALFVLLGASLPQKGTVVATRTIVVSLVVGTVITLIAGLFPAVRATRVPAISAVKEGAVLPKSRIGRFAPYISLALLALALLLIVYGIFLANGAAAVLVPLGFGTLLLFIAIALVSQRLVTPLAAVLGGPARRFGGAAGRLASENAVRNPGRTASTAAALMIGLALVTFVATLGRGLHASDEDGLKSSVSADYVVASHSGFDPFPAKAGETLANAPRVTLASSVRQDEARAAGADATVNGVDPATITRVYKFEWKRGSDALLSQLGSDGAVVKEGFATDHHLTVGKKFTLQTPSGRKLSLTVKGIDKASPKVDDLLGTVAVSTRTFDANFPRPKNIFTFANVEGGATDANTAALKQRLSGFPDAKVRTKSQWVKKRVGEIDSLLNLLYVLLALSVIVSLFGMVNTLALTVFERTRELGMLRAVGMTRRQVRRMIRHESVITALIGAALGLPLGIGLAALVTSRLSSEGLSFHLPYLTLVIFVLVAFGAGVLAAVLPARRAARLRVLEALQYE